MVSGSSTSPEVAEFCPLMTAAYGSVISETGDGCLGLASTTTSPAVALCLRGPDATGYIEYYKY